MINHVYRLVSPRQFEITYTDCSLLNKYIIVRPTHLSICAADQRYYTGTRGKETMSKKLPMALIHEGIGKVVYDPEKEFLSGTQVVMIPNTPIEIDEIISENYLRSSKFRASGFDGFMQDYVFLSRDRVVPLFDGINPFVAAFTELITISMHALTRFEKLAHPRRNVFGIWGDGNLGYITALLLKEQYVDSKVYVFGKNMHKLSHFAFVDEVFLIDQLPDEIHLDHVFECVGGKGSQFAINQAIDYIQPEGTISILGVSEYPVEINTRMVLEKGLTIIGSSRSGREDFIRTLAFLEKYRNIVDYLETLVGEIKQVRSIQDIIDSFEVDNTTLWGKTVMEWKI